MKKRKGPKILLFDVETAPMLAYVWGLFDQNIGLNQIHTDWHLLSWAAKWLDKKKVMYMDQSKAKNVSDDRKILKGIWKLLDEADIVVTQNGKAFDVKKLNARFVLNGMAEPSSYKHIDTLVTAKSKFAFTSNKLAYMSGKLCKKYKKLNDADKKFPGFDLWKECLAGNKKAWKEMERYNKQDVYSLEELYKKLRPWDNSVDFNLYTDALDWTCKCGGMKLKKNGYFYSSAGKYQRYKCVECGSESRDKKNLLSKVKKNSLLVKTTRN